MKKPNALTAGRLLIFGGTGCTEAHLRGIPVDPTIRDDKLRITGTF